MCVSIFNIVCAGSIRILCVCVYICKRKRNWTIVKCRQVLRFKFILYAYIHAHVHRQWRFDTSHFVAWLNHQRMRKMKTIVSNKETNVNVTQSLYTWFYPLAKRCERTFRDHFSHAEFMRNKNIDRQSGLVIANNKTRMLYNK